MIFKSPVTVQPTEPNLPRNTFSILDGEHFIRLYQCNEGCSSCCGPKSNVIFTAKRIIVRHQDPAFCCCCCEGHHIDTAIFMRDIEVMKESTDTTMNSCMAVMVLILTCTWPLILCKGCCGDYAKIMEVKGAFGSELLKFKQEDFKYAADQLSSIILPMKN
ncbi:unnamed protein product [Adineta ricciae]|uniref:Uncharacterized protein n=1 Tax=Adineta ricciae TaxID=249248 RepID=A0A815KZ45_ADIRI|nr:unnamed protein product [Adineta ricciae]CAF1553518.1 unnamed protein product [Adineta ricciae]